MKKIFSLLFVCVATCLYTQAATGLVWTQKTDLTLADGVEVYATTSTINGRAFAAWYAIADLPSGKVELRCLNASSQKLSSYYSSLNGNALVAINGGYFSSGSSLSLVTDMGIAKAINIASLSRQSKTYPITRGVMGVNAQQTPSCGWSYTVNGDTWLYPEPLKQVEGDDPLATPNTNSPANGKIWGEYSAMGGGPLLVKNSVQQFDYTKNGNGFYLTNYELFASDIFGNGLKQPRTAMGYRADGKMILFVCDGRGMNGSTGATLDEVAEIMMELGCTDVLNLDGGGSTEMIAGGAIMNKPSDGTERALVSAVVFAKPSPETAFSKLKQTLLWDNTVNSTNKPNWKYAATFARDIATVAGKVYIPIRKDGSLVTEDGIRIINGSTGNVEKIMSMTGINSENSTHIISGIAVTADSVILVSNLQTTIAEDKPFKIYQYDTPNSEAKELLRFTGSATSGLTGNRLGDNFTYEGTIKSGTIHAISSNNGELNKYVYIWQVENGVVINQEPTKQPLYANDGTTLLGNTGTMARINKAKDGSYWMKGTTSSTSNRPKHFNSNFSQIGAVEASSLRSYLGNTCTPFEYDGRKYIALIDYAGGTTASKAQGVILDVTDSDNGVEKFRTAQFGPNTNLNVTDGVAVALYDKGFRVYFLSGQDGAMAYQFGDIEIETGSTPIEKEQFMVYPNPTSDFVYFETSLKQVSIYSLTGNKILSANNTSSLCVKGLQGLFILKGITDSGNVVSTKLIIK